MTATVQTIGVELDPALEVSCVEADLDDATLPPERRQVGVEGRVRLVGRGPAASPPLT